MSWVKYLVYILSFFVPPVGVITFWVLMGRDEELTEIGRCSFLAAFIGIIVWIIVSIFVGINYQIPWSGMWRW
jgi:hypothetical protein